MILATLRAWWHFPLRRLSIYAEGRTERLRSPLVLVGNNEYDLAGLSLGRRERLDRGELCLYLAKKQSRLSLLWLACRSVLGLVERSQDLQILKVCAAEIRSHASRLLVACDGEVEVMRSPLHYRTKPGALRVLAPDVAMTARSPDGANGSAPTGPREARPDDRLRAIRVGDRIKPAHDESAMTTTGIDPEVR